MLSTGRVSKNSRCNDAPGDRQSCLGKQHMAFPTGCKDVMEYQEAIVRKYLKDSEKIHCWGEDPKGWKALELVGELLMGKDQSAVDLISDNAYAHAAGTLRYAIDMLLEAYLERFCAGSEATESLER